MPGDGCTSDGFRNSSSRSPLLGSFASKIVSAIVSASCRADHDLVREQDGWRNIAIPLTDLILNVAARIHSSFR